jgi:hypothetical protein
MCILNLSRNTLTRSFREYFDHSYKISLLKSFYLSLDGKMSIRFGLLICSVKFRSLKLLKKLLTVLSLIPRVLDN